MSGVDQRALRLAVERVARPYSDFAQVATRAIEEYVREVGGSEDLRIRTRRETEMETMEMRDLQVGWWGLFDAVYGPEKVLAVTRYTLTDPTGVGPLYGVGVNVLHLHVTDERGESPVGRFITRAEHEPVLAMTFPDRRPSEADLDIADGRLVECAPEESETP